jgi:hypothetical protein
MLLLIVQKDIYHRSPAPDLSHARGRGASELTLIVRSLCQKRGRTGFTVHGWGAQILVGKNFIIIVLIGFFLFISPLFRGFRWSAFKVSRLLLLLLRFQLFDHQLPSVDESTCLVLGLLVEQLSFQGWVDSLPDLGLLEKVPINRQELKVPN